MDSQQSPPNLPTEPTATSTALVPNFHQKFTLFPQLPFDVRVMIWDIFIPDIGPQKIQWKPNWELAKDYSEVFWKLPECICNPGEDQNECDYHSWVLWRNKWLKCHKDAYYPGYLGQQTLPDLPITLFINQESRTESLKRYKLMTIPRVYLDKEGQVRERVRFMLWDYHFCETNAYLYFNPKRDTLVISSNAVTICLPMGRDDDSYTATQFYESPLGSQLLEWSTVVDGAPSLIQNLEFKETDWDSIFQVVNWEEDVDCLWSGIEFVTVGMGWLLQIIAIFPELKKLTFFDNRNVNKHDFEVLLRQLPGIQIEFDGPTPGRSFPEWSQLKQRYLENETN